MLDRRHVSAMDPRIMFGQRRRESSRRVAFLWLLPIGSLCKSHMTSSPMLEDVGGGSEPYMGVAAW